MYTVIENVNIASKTYKMTLAGDFTNIKSPGQFVNIKLDGFFLRRPISVCDYDRDSLTIVYKTVGGGTEKMSLLEKGTELDILTGLGNGFSTFNSGDAPLLIGGGVGLPPMFALAKKLVSENKTPRVIAGFNTAVEVFMKDEFDALGIPCDVATADGTYGHKGLVTDLMDVDYSYFYACGPLPMLKAVCKFSVADGELSLEERMGCGFGICMGCSIETARGPKRICTDGPVFRKEDLIF